MYANAKIITEEDVELESSSEVINIKVDEFEMNKVEDETLGYQYEMNLENVDSTTIVVNTKNPYAKVKVEKIDNIAYKEPNIKRLSTNKTIDLNLGDNYFKITVTSENKKNTKSFIIKIYLEKTHEIINAESILDALSNNLTSGYYDFRITSDNETITYPVHLYVLDGNQVFSEDKIFGDSGDVGTTDSYAKNMVIVKVKGDLTVNEKVTVSPYYTEYGGPKGFTLYVDGTLTNYGTIDNSHGAYAEGENVYLYKNSDGTYEYIPEVGAKGGTGKLAKCCNKNYSGEAGFEGSNRSTGGGGAGGSSSGDSEPRGTSGSGGYGTSYSGGAGGGGSNHNSYGKWLYAGDGSSFGGAGGDAYGYRESSSWYTRRAGGGAGNPGGFNAENGLGNIKTISGENGTGGLLIIYSNSLKNSGYITANGSVGSGYYEAGGGSSGGGSINIFVNGSFDDNGNINADGGIESEASSKGGAGGNGTITISYYYKGNFISELLEENEIDIIKVENIDEFESIDRIENEIDKMDGYQLQFLIKDDIQCTPEDDSIVNIVDNKIYALKKGTTKINCKFKYNNLEVNDSIIVNTTVLCQVVLVEPKTNDK